MIKDCRRTQAMHKIEELRGIHASAMRDSDLLVIDAITDEGIQNVFNALSQLLDIAESVVQYSVLNENSMAWFQDEIEALAQTPRLVLEQD